MWFRRMIESARRPPAGACTRTSVGYVRPPSDLEVIATSLDPELRVHTGSVYIKPANP
jgi:hypothetical protein